jgi:hypothetical protein
VAREIHRSLKFLPAALAEELGDQPFVTLVRTPDELVRWLGQSPEGLQWIEVEGLLDNLEAWRPATQPSASQVPLDIILTKPASEFANLYRLVDVSARRELRVSMPAVPGFFKAVKLAASLRLPIRLLPGQPTPEGLSELTEALEFYLHGPMVEAPLEFFHSLLATAAGADNGSLWMILEEDPVAFQRYDDEGRQQLPRPDGIGAAETFSESFVENRLRTLLDQGAECASCRWQQVCRGYFKWPDPAYSCEGVKELFSRLDEAADEIEQDLAIIEEQPNLRR